MPYQPKYSQFIKDEIKRLAAGNTDERKRARTVKEKISAILLDPLNNIFKKTLPDDYCAVDIGERFRLFFKPLPLLRKRTLRGSMMRASHIP